MKSIKTLALILGAIVLFPSISFAGENISGTAQEINMGSTTIGTGNLVVTDVTQQAINVQKAGRRGTNVSGIGQTTTAVTTTLGDYNTVIQTAIQNSKNVQKAK